jgi:hypothetical protein
MRPLARAALLAPLCIGCMEPQPSQLSVTPADAWRVERIENPTDSPGVIYFSGRRSFETGLMRVEHLGTLPGVGRAPFLVLAGYGCNDCDINRSIYLHSPSDGVIQGESQPRYSYPGSLIEWDTEDPAEEIIHRARVFVGDCVAEVAGPVVLWIIDARTSGMTAEIASVEADTLRLDLLGSPEHQLRGAEEAARQNRCREIEPFDQGREP